MCQLGGFMSNVELAWRAWHGTAKITSVTHCAVHP